MSEYRKYQHVEKLGSGETHGILNGDVYVFPKLDGTNAHAWWDEEQEMMRYGSRKRELTAEGSDNAGFRQAMLGHEGLTRLCKKVAPAHVYGEWLVPHSLRTYRDDAWRKFYLFDIVDENGMHCPYDELRNLCDDYEVEYIAPIRILHNPTAEHCMRTLDENSYLINDGEGSGEGVVLKNYSFVNKYGRQTWAKIVTSEFKDKHTKAMGAPRTACTKLKEELFAETFCTDALIEKVFANICVSEDGWKSQFISRLINTVFYDVVREHTWDAVKKWKCPTIDFKVLNQFVTQRIKTIKPELF